MTRSPTDESAGKGTYHHHGVRFQSPEPTWWEERINCQFPSDLLGEHAPPTPPNTGSKNAIKDGMTTTRTTLCSDRKKLSIIENVLIVET